MAYKRYIKRGDKIYGPYVYHSKKVGGKVISEYHGTHKKVESDKKKKNILKSFKILGIVFIFLLLLLIIFNLNFTGRVILEDEFAEINPEIINQAKEISILEVSLNLNTTQYGAVINEPVKWKKKIKVNKNDTVKIKLPKQAKNITVYKLSDEEIIEEELNLSQTEINETEIIVNETIEEEVNETVEEINDTEIVSNESIEINEIDVVNETEIIVNETIEEEVNETKEEVSDEQVNITMIVGGVILDFDSESVFKRFFASLIGKVIDIEEKEEFVEVTIDENATEFEITYTTPGPTSKEVKIDKGKRITISSDIHYKDVFAYTSLPKEVPESSIKLYHYKNKKRVPVNFKSYDVNNNSLTDYVTWVIPYMSNQTYELIIEITKAEHLNENKEFISDIYNEVSVQDDVWSELINNLEYVRVTFEIPLDSTRDITIYARSQGIADLEVYTQDGNDLIAIIENISGEDWYKTYLTGLENTTDVFDLRVVGDAIEFDYVVDPELGECGTISSSGYYTLTSNVSNTGTCFTVSAANVTIDCNDYWITYSTGGGSGNVGIYTNRFNTTVKNCNVVDGNWSSSNTNRRGILFDVSTNGTINNTFVNTSNSLALWVLDSNYTSVLNTRAYSNSNRGVYFDGYYNSFTNVTAISNSSGGFFLDSANNNTLINCTATSNSGPAIEIRKSNYINVTNCIATSTSSYAFWVYDTWNYGLIVSENIFISNGTRVVGLGENTTKMIFYNNTLISQDLASNLLDIDSWSGNNLFYHNNFTETTGYFVDNANETNQFNTTVGGVAQGNYYFNITSIDIVDSDSDGWGDAGSDYPLNDTNWPARWNNLGADYGPYTTQEASFDCQTISTPGYYTLTGNVTSTGTCFTISEENVTLDCNNYWINYSTDGEANTRGIYSTEDNTTIKNCNIVDGNWSGGEVGRSGIRYSTSHRGKIDNVTVNASTGYGVEISGSDYNNITNSIFYSSSNTGIILTGAESNNFSRVEGWTFVTAKGIGLYSGSIYNIFYHSKGFSYGSDGLYFASGANNNTLFNITGVSTNSHGIRIAGDNNIFENSSGSSNAGGMGISFNGGDNNTFTDSNGTSISGNGIGFSPGVNNVCTRCRGISGSGDGISFGGGDNNNVTDSIIMSTGNDGMYLTSDSDGNIFSGSTFISNGSDVIRFNTNSDNNIFYNNTFITEDGAAEMVDISSSSTNNTFYWNNFTETSGYYVNNDNETNQFNTTVGGVAQGNYYFNISAQEVYDSDSDGWGDSGAAYPLNDTNWPAKWNNLGADYGPYTTQEASFDCQTITSPGYYTMTGNVTSTGTCFTVSAPNVTIDCAGYAINYSTGGAANTRGIYSNQDNTTIENCSVFDGNWTEEAGANRIGIYFSGADNGHIQNTYVNVSNGIGIDIADYSNITDSVFVSDSNYGILIRSNNILTNVSVLSNSEIAMYLNDDNNNIFTNCTFYSTSSTAILSLGSQNNTFIDSNITGGGGRAIYLSGDLNTFIRSNGTSSSANAIYLDGNNNTFVGGKYVSGSDYAIQIHDGANYTNITRVTAISGYIAFTMYGGVYYSTISESNFTANGTIIVSLGSTALHNIFNNNTFSTGDGAGTLVNIGASSGNNTFYWNNFTETTGYFVDNDNETNQFNTTVGGVAQGNYYFNITSIDIVDSDSDGWGDAGSDYPLNDTNWPARWNNLGADYGPYTTNQETIPPTITWENPTPGDGDVVNDTFVYLNTTITDTNDVSAWFDWNKSLVGYWSMDYYNSTGVYDNSSYDNFGVFNGGIGTSNITTGKRGYGLEFDGGNDYVDVQYDNSINMSGKNFTFSAWVKPDVSAAHRTVIGWSSNGGPLIRIHADDRIFFNRQGQDVVGIGGTINEEAWNFVAITYDSGTGGYVIRVNAATSSGTNEQTFTFSNLQFGLEGSSSPMLGEIDEVMIFNRVLSEQEINATFDAGTYRLENNFTGLVDGTYNYSAYAIDAAGNLNITSPDREVTVDTSFPCQTITSPGTYTLTSNLTSTGTCFTVSAANVTIDCDNYYINYSSGGAANTRGVYSNQFNTTVKNCNVIDGNYSSTETGRYGIYFNGADNGIIENNLVKTNNSNAIYTDSGANYNVLLDNNGTSSNGAGISLASSDYAIVNRNYGSGYRGGLRLSYSEHGTFENNTGYSPGGEYDSAGIYMDGFCNNLTLINNTGTSGTWYGIVISNNASVYNNTGISASSTGLWISGQNSVVEGNNGTGSGGISIYGGDYNNLTNNVGFGTNSAGIGFGATATNNILINNTGQTVGSAWNAAGIFIWYSHNNTLINNTGFDNGTGDGISIGNSGDNIITGGNFTSYGSYYGLTIGNSNGTIISNNTFTSNTSVVIYIESSSNNNTFYNNTFITSGGSTILSMTSNTYNNIFYHNNFTETSGYFVENWNETNQFNTTVNGVAQGNYYFNLSNTLDIYDSNSDGWGDAGSDYPLNDTNWPAKWNNLGADYGPYTTQEASFDCQTITSPGYYTMTGNVTSTGTCFTVSEANVTIDCNNYWINYSTGGEASTRGIYSTEDNTTIKNCNIVDGNWTNSETSRRGIFFTGTADNGTIQDTFINVSNSYGVLIDSSYNVILRVNSTSNSSAGIRVSYGDYNNVTDCIGTSNSGSGIYFYEANYNGVYDSTGISNTGSGINIQSSNNNTFDGVLGNSSTGMGIYLWGTGGQHNLTNSIGFSGLHRGIYTSGGTNYFLENNTGIGGIRAGIWLDGGTDDSIIINNTGTTNGSEWDSRGIYVSDSAARIVFRDNTGISYNASIGIELGIVDSFVINNTAISNSSRISEVSSGSTNNTFRNNTFISQDGDGTLLYIRSNAGDNTFYWNNFTQTSGYFVDNLNETNKFNTTVNGVAQGNYYFNISAQEVYDSDSDNWGDSGAAYPLNDTNWPARWNNLGADYGPYTTQEASFDCQTISSPGYYTLISNVTSTGTCFTIDSDNVTLDCNNYKITYSTGGVDNNLGITSQQKDNVTVKNCNVVDGNWSGGTNRHGIYFYDVNNDTIQNSFVNTSNGAAIYVYVAGSVNVTDSTGISDSFIGMYIRNTENSTIRDNIATSISSQVGLNIITSSNNSFINNTVTSSWNNVVRIATVSLNNTLTNNTFIAGSGSSTLLSIDSGSGNNTFYYNNFTQTTNYYVNNDNETNQFNTTVGGVAQGNYYFNITSLDIIDSDSDGWGDAGTAYPLNDTNWPARWNNLGADYGPYTSNEETTPPTITWENPTPPTPNTTTDNFVYLNTTITDTNDVSAWFDWNKSLVGYWSMDYYNSTGVYDNSSYDNFGVFSGTLGTDNLTDGARGYGLEFNGNDDFINISNDIGNSPQNMTLMAWVVVKGDGVGDYQGIVSWAGTTFNDGGFLTYNKASDTFEFYVDDGLWQTARSNTVNNDVWYHVVGVADNGAVKIYINGELGPVVDTYGTIDWDNGIDQVTIGMYHPATDDYFNGTIDEVLIFNRSFSEQEINATYNAGTYRLENNFTGLGDGTYNYSAYAMDAAGNLNITSPDRQVIVDTADTTAPYFTSIPANVSLWYGNESLGVDFDADDAVGFDSFSINDTNLFAINSTGWLSNATSLSVGNYAINVTINDTSNNINWTIYTVEVNQSNYGCNVLFNETSPLEYPELFEVYSDCDSAFTLYRNSTTISNNSVQNNGVGYYNFTVQRTDTENYTYTVDTEFFIVDQSPEICEVLYNETSPLEYPGTFTVWANCTSAFVLSRNGTTITNNSQQSLAIGAYNFSMLRNDTANYSYIYNESMFVINDTTYPLISIIYPTATNYTTNVSELNYTYTETNPDKCWWSNNSGIWNSSTQTCGDNWTGLLSNEGSNTWTVYINDTSGNENSSGVTFFKDTIAPYFTVLVNQTGYGNESLIYDINATDDGIGIEAFFIDDTTNFSINSTTGVITNASVLIEYYYVVNVSVNDSLGNLNWSLWSYNVSASDSIYPQFSNYQRNPVTPNEDQDIQVNVTITETNLETVILEWNGTTNYTISTSNGDEYYYTMLQGNYTAHDSVTYYWYANDTSGNLNKSAQQSFTVANQIPSVTQPTINDTNPYTNELISCNSGTFSDSDAEDTESSREFLWYDNDVEVSGQTSQTLDLTTAGLDKGDVILCSVRVSDLYDWSSWQNSSNSATIENSAPTIDNPQTTVSWDANGSTYNYDYNVTDLDSESFTWYDNSSLFDINPSTGEISDTPTEGEVGTYFIEINVSDGTVNTTDTFTYTINDVGYPLILVVYPVAINYTTNVSELNYTYTETNVDKCWWSNNSGIWNSSTQTCGDNFTGLISNEGSNTWTVYINDTSGNENSSGVTFFKDTIAPYFTVLANQTAPINQTFSYDVNATDDGIGLDVFSLNDTSNFTINPGTGVITNVTNLSEEAFYILNLSVNDSLGNLNWSIFTINITSESIPPEVRITAPTPGQTFTSSTVSFLAKTNEASSCNYTLNAGATNHTMTANATNTGFTDSQSLSNAAYTALFYCEDIFGNLNDTESVSFTVTVEEGGDGSPGGGGTPSIEFTVPATYEKTIPLEESELGEITLINDGRLKATFNIKVESLDNILILNQGDVTVDGQSSGQIQFTVVSPNETGIYTGKIIVSSPDSTSKEILVTILVTEGESLFDVTLTIPLSMKTIKPDSHLLAHVNLLQMGIKEEMDVTIEYVIKDFNDTVHFTESETIAVYKQKAFDKELNLEGIPEGDYVLGIEVIYPGGVATASTHFNIKSGFSLGLFEIIIGLLILAVIAISLIIFFLLRKRKKIAELKKPAETLGAPTEIPPAVEIPTEQPAGSPVEETKLGETI